MIFKGRDESKFISKERHDSLSTCLWQISENKNLIYGYLIDDCKLLGPKPAGQMC